jgi:hypothetical protein
MTDVLGAAWRDMDRQRMAAHCYRRAVLVETQDDCGTR